MEQSIEQLSIKSKKTKKVKYNENGKIHEIIKQLPNETINTPNGNLRSTKNLKKIKRKIIENEEIVKLIKENDVYLVFPIGYLIEQVLNNFTSLAIYYFISYQKKIYKFSFSNFENENQIYKLNLEWNGEFNEELPDNEFQKLIPYFSSIIINFPDYKQQCEILAKETKYIESQNRFYLSLKLADTLYEKFYLEFKHLFSEFEFYDLCYEIVLEECVGFVPITNTKF